MRELTEQEANIVAGAGAFHALMTVLGMTGAGLLGASAAAQYMPEVELPHFGQMTRDHNAVAGFLTAMSLMYALTQEKSHSRF